MSSLVHPGIFVNCIRESTVIGLSVVAAPLRTIFRRPSMVQHFSTFSAFLSLNATLDLRGVKCSTINASGYSPLSSSFSRMPFFFLIREFLTVLERNLTSIVERPVSLLGNQWVILNSSLGREMLALSKNLTTVSSVSSCWFGGKSVGSLMPHIFSVSRF